MTGNKLFKVLLVGNPNVGKSVIFYHLTGKYASVSNYPGTTVAITSGKTKVGDHHEIEVIDTPGFYNLITITEEESVTKQIILDEKPDVVLHVIDAKNIERMLPLTLQLIEAGLPVILTLNMFDELIDRGLDIQISHLEHDLGIPVVATVAIKGEGINNLKTRIVSVAENRYRFQESEVQYTDYIDEISKKVESMLKKDYNISKRATALLLMQKDKDILKMIKDEENFSEVMKIINSLNDSETGLTIAYKRHQQAAKIIKEHLSKDGIQKSQKIRNIIDSVTMHPISGFIIVALILYFGFYKFVGNFGAGYLVDLIETNIFENIINPKVNSFFQSILGNTIFFNLFAGDYGIITLGIRYAFAIVLPVVFTFFLMFSVLEDSGYLVRLSMILDKMLKSIGLTGRSVIPLILGLGCGTMATVVTRTLETAKERLMVTFLLALTIPCSAQLGVILGLLGSSIYALLGWFVIILSIFIVSGLILKKYTKGDTPSFFMEVPPLRFPIIGNVLNKTYTRLKWYALEIIPIFVYASILIWAGKITKVFDFFTHMLSYPAKWAGLPEKTGEIFLYGFFRRDFGAAGLFDIKDSFTTVQLIVVSVILTLFVPCIAQFSVMIKERGAKTASIIFFTVIPFAFISGILLNKILSFWW